MHAKECINRVNGSVLTDDAMCCAEALRCEGDDGGCCTTSTPCSLFDGDCDYDADCSGDLTCGTDNCEQFTDIHDHDDDCCTLAT